ncbi:hypothetical protein VP01_2056g1 [Puccinia sorghi]|uniref:Uncharacterized protein n=1 Tax=Puccinia sorghi TaxID=27349 RepID=A0A0L6VBD7_9BASI|nr:hypothetical protein VP01_2056g1 [Puccinia sorghi]
MPMLQLQACFNPSPYKHSHRPHPKKRNTHALTPPLPPVTSPPNGRAYMALMHPASISTCRRPSGNSRFIGPCESSKICKPCIKYNEQFLWSVENEDWWRVHRLLEGIVFIGCGLVASYTFWRSGMRKREEGESMAPAGKKGRIRVGSQVECSEEWIPLNQSGRRRGSSIITTIERHPVQKNHPSHTKNIHHHSTTTLSSSPRPLLVSLFLIPTIFFLSYAFAALISGSLVGWAIAALYNAAFLRMSTWVPALWSAALSLILIISSYSNISTVL